jgi:hypothetical protein
MLGELIRVGTRGIARSRADTATQPARLRMRNLNYGYSQTISSTTDEE